MIQIESIKVQKRRGLILIIIGLIFLIFTTIWGLIWSLQLGIYVLAMGYPIIYFEVFGILILLLGIYTFLSSPRNKGLLLLIIGLTLSIVGIYYTLNILLNLEIFRTEPQIIAYVSFPVIIGVILILVGIKRVIVKLN
ncbi:hypothetical protein LCGC14_1924480 [marine sediment metagenome]|uniref:Uncharacterized protein n=1 Tax=marine sediment metagenome TaxID=412755 RepID=A0A0F9GD75_9ZZZZ